MSLHRFAKATAGLGIAAAALLHLSALAEAPRGHTGGAPGHGSPSGHGPGPSHGPGPGRGPGPSRGPGPGHGPSPGRGSPGRDHFGGWSGYRQIPPPPHMADRWHGGRWYHGDHDHRGGWWWIVGGSWFWYPQPVYPYPDFYIPPTVVIEQPPGPPPAQYWYYCDLPAGYYPYVTQCSVPWKAVAATPPPSPPPPAY